MSPLRSGRTHPDRNTATKLGQNTSIGFWKPSRSVSHQGVDALVGEVVVSGGVALHQLAVLGVVALADLVDLLVDLRAVVVAFLTSTGH